MEIAKEPRRFNNLYSRKNVKTNTVNSHLKTSPPKRGSIVVNI